MFLPAIWVVLFFASNFDLSARSSTAAAQSASAENLIELAIYAIVALLSLHVLVVHVRSYSWIREGLGAGLIAVFAGVALVSTLWASHPAFTFARAGQVSAVALLALASIRLWREGERSPHRDWRTVWFSVTGVLSLLAASAFLFPNPTDGRFAWVGMHPIPVGGLLAVAIVVCVSALLESSSELNRPRNLFTMGFVFVAFGLLILTRTRSALLGLTIGLAAVFLTWTKRRVGLRPLVVPVVIGAAMAAWTFFFNDIWKYLLRDQTTEQFAAGTGRSELVEPAIELFKQQPLAGHGYGAARFAFLDEFEWATNGHNIAIQLGIDLGLFGLAMGSALVVWAVALALRVHRVAPGHVSNAAFGWLAVAVVIGLADPSFSLVGHTMTGLFLVLAVLSAVDPGPRRTVARARRLPPPPTDQPSRAGEI